MRFDLEGNRIVVRPTKPAETREPAYYFEQEKVNDWGYCDKPMGCEDSESVTHLCSRFNGHTGGCVAVHKGEVSGRKVRRLEYFG